jgi:ribosomal protein S18 acetylase RimI-like enzyme
VQDTPHDLHLLLDFDPGAVLVAEVDGEMVGTVVATWDGWRGGIHRLVVLPAHRRLGIGRALVDAAHERLEGLGAKRINILVAEADPGAGDLWRAAGYRTNPQIARFFRDS